VFRKNEQPTALYQVISGEIRILNVTREGKEVLYLTFSEGDCFGEIGLLDGQPRPHNAVASRATILSVLRKSDFDDLRHKHPEFNEQVTLVLCRRLHLLFGYFESTAIMPLPNRLAKRIFDLATSQRGNNELPQACDINLSQNDLANMMGASRQATGRILKQWEEQKLIRLDYGKTTILDLNSIQDIADQQ